MGKRKIGGGLAAFMVGLSLSLVGCNQPSPTTPSAPQPQLQHLPDDLQAQLDEALRELTLPSYRLEASSEYQAAYTTYVLYLKAICYDRIYKGCLRSGRSKPTCGTYGRFCVRVVSNWLRHRLGLPHMTMERH
jgi:hypothetical protein